MVIEGEEELSVSWDAVSGADGYKVQWKTDSQQFDSSRQHTITNGATTSYTISNLLGGREYVVRIIATKSDADDAMPSLEVTGTPSAPEPPVQAPEQVTGVMVIEGEEELSVSWDAVSGAGGYKVQWKTDSQQFDSSRQHTITNGATTSYTISNLLPEREYVVRVIATKSDADDAMPSLEVTGTPSAPEPPVQSTEENLKSGEGGGCVLASDSPTGDRFGSGLFNSLLIVLFLLVISRRRRSRVRQT